MPVSAGTVQFSYTGDGATTVFPFPSRFLTNSDIIVGIDGVQVFAGFTVTGAGDDAGGNVTFSVAPVGATAITLIRAPSINQLLDFVNNQTVLAQNIDNGLDKLTIVAQYLSYLLDRALKLDRFDTGLTGDFDVMSRRLKNVAAPVDDTDAARLSDLQGVVAGAGNVPLPTAGQVGYLMQATGVDTFGWISRAVALGAALEAIRGLTPAADRAPYFTSTSVAALMTVTSFARTLLDDADAAAMRTTLEAQKKSVRTEFATTSGSEFDVAGIPVGVNWARGTMYRMSLSGGADDFLVRLGTSGGLVSSGYEGVSMPSPFSGSTGFSTGFRIQSRNVNGLNSGHFLLTRGAGNTWVFSSETTYGSTAGALAMASGVVSLGSDLSQIRFMQAASDTFDNGSLVIEYGF